MRGFIEKCILTINKKTYIIAYGEKIMSDYKSILNNIELNEDAFEAYKLSFFLTDAQDIKKCEDIILNGDDTSLMLHYGLTNPNADKARCLKMIAINRDLKKAKLLIHRGGMDFSKATETLKSIKPEMSDGDILAMLLDNSDN